MKVRRFKDHLAPTLGRGAAGEGEAARRHVLPAPSESGDLPRHPAVDFCGEQKGGLKRRRASILPVSRASPSVAVDRRFARRGIHHDSRWIAVHFAVSLSPIVCLLTLCFLGIVTGPALAGQSRVELSGVVRDISGAVVTDARVEALVAGRSVATVTTDKDGRYRLDVPAGAPIAVRASRDGFADEQIELPGRREPLTRDLMLRVGGLSDTLVVTASRNAESRANLLQPVTVTTKAEMEALGSSSLADLMRFVPGVNIEATGREGALTSMFARGGESDYNLVLVDGVRVNISGGQFDFSRVGTGEIERVEVLRGAQSALWGSDAMGSVVQIFTKRAGPGDAPLVSASIEGGTFDTFRGDAR